MGEKIGQLVYAISMFISGLCIAFYQGPIFTLVSICYMPLMVGVISIFGGLVGKKMREKLIQTKKLGAHTEETLSALKLVVSFAQEDLAVSKYDEIASQSKELATKASVTSSIVHGLFLFFMFGFFLYSYAVGGWMIEDQRINPATGQVYSVVEVI